MLSPSAESRIEAVRTPEYPGRGDNDAFAEARSSYEETVQPILEAKCFDCHTGDHVPKQFPLGYRWLGPLKERVDRDMEEGLRGLDLGGGFPFLRDGVIRFDTLAADMARLEATLVEDTMPPRIYRVVHRGSALTREERAAIEEWLIETQRVLGVRGQVARTLPERVETVLEYRCADCHGDRGAGGFDYVTNLRALVRGDTRGRRWVIPNDPERSPLLESITSGRMPKPPVTMAEGELDLLRSWIEQGAPTETVESRSAPDDTSLRAAMIHDLESRDATERPFLRYFSFANLDRSSDTDASLISYREALLFVLNSTSWAPRTGRLSTVEGTQGAVVRVDLRDFDLTPDRFAAVEDSYPYMIVTSDSRKLAGLHGGRVDVIRADWFVRFASIPPLYHSLLEIPRSIEDLERRLGIGDACASIRTLQVQRAGFARSGVSAFNRVIERHDTRYGAFWLSYDFAKSDADGDIFKNPLGPSTCTPNHAFSHDGGEVIFTLPNGFFGYALVDARGARLDTDAPQTIVSDRLTGAAITNAVSCMGCHRQGLIPQADEVREHVAARAKAKAIDEASAASVQALYVPREKLRASLDHDNEQYQAALVSAGVSPVRERDPVRALVNRFEQPLDTRTAAAEFSLSPEEFASRIAEAGPSFAELRADLETRGIPRKRFVKRFPELVTALHIGAPLDAIPLPFDDTDRKGDRATGRAHEHLPQKCALAARFDFRTLASHPEVEPIFRLLMAEFDTNDPELERAKRFFARVGIKEFTDVGEVAGCVERFTEDTDFTISVDGEFRRDSLLAAHRLDPDPGTRIVALASGSEVIAEADEGFSAQAEDGVMLFARQKGFLEGSLPASARFRESYDLPLAPTFAVTADLRSMPEVKEPVVLRAHASLRERDIKLSITAVSDRALPIDVFQAAQLRAALAEGPNAGSISFHQDNDRTVRIEAVVPLSQIRTALANI